MARKKKIRKRVWILLVSLFGVLTVLLVSFFAYASVYYRPTEEALTYLADSEKSEVVEEKDVILFRPKENASLPEERSGIIFYPGGKVDERAYAPLLRDLSDNGIASVLVRMPFRLAVFNVSGAKGKKEKIPEVKDWYIGGHSLGGAMAASYLGKNPDEFDGLLLLGAYSTIDLSSHSRLRTLSLLASNDKVLNWAKYESDRKNLPSLTEETIQGGIHSYFGDYGLQKGDGTPEITFEEQKKEMVEAISRFVLGA